MLYSFTVDHHFLFVYQLQKEDRTFAVTALDSTSSRLSSNSLMRLFFCIFFLLPFCFNFDEITLSRTVKEIEANLCFAIFGKNSKIQNGRHFGGGENFLKIAKITFLRYPVGRKFRRNHSISHG